MFKLITNLVAKFNADVDALVQEAEVKAQEALVKSAELKRTSNARIALWKEEREQDLQRRIADLQKNKLSDKDQALVDAWLAEVDK